jgi:hypothetical protein
MLCRNSAVRLRVNGSYPIEVIVSRIGSNNIDRCLVKWNSTLIDKGPSILTKAALMVNGTVEVKYRTDGKNDQVTMTQ